MQDIRREPPWKQITFFLLTLVVLVLGALQLQPFFSAIFGAIVLAVVTKHPYDWLVFQNKKPVRLRRGRTNRYHAGCHRPDLLPRARAEPTGDRHHQRFPQRGPP